MVVISKKSSQVLRLQSLREKYNLKAEPSKRRKRPLVSMKNKKNTLKFLLGQETGYKVEAVAVAQEMRYARDGGGNRGFTIDEFLAPQRVTSFFSRMASKLKNKTKRSSKNIRLPLRFKLPSPQPEQIFSKTAS